MNKKGFVNIILVVVVVILVGAVGYFAFVKKSEPVTQQNPTPTPTKTTNPSPTLNPTSTPTQTPTPTPIKPSPIQKSGIKGTVIGMYCNGAQPAEPPPDYQQCGEEFLASFLLKIKNDISGIEKQVTTDNIGKFQIELSSGKYTITQASEGSGIIGGPFNVEVKSGAFTATQLKFQELRP